MSAPFGDAGGGGTFPVRHGLVAADDLAQRPLASLRLHAERERVPMRLTPSELEAVLIDSGAGSAFGVVWDQDGRRFRDRQEPEPGFLDRWKAQTGDGRVLPGSPPHEGG